MKTGVDIVKIKRIKDILGRNQPGFYRKVFTEREIEYIESKNNDPKTVAGIFASKEAVSKLIGTGIGYISWKDIEILHNKKNRPYISLNQKLSNMLSLLNLNSIDLSISHEDDYAIAFAVGYKGDSSFSVPDDIQDIITRRDSNTHKGTYGRVGIIAGSTGMTGAAYLSSIAALRSGSGLVYSIVPSDLVDIMSIKLTEVIVKGYNDKMECLELINSMDGLVLGPGLGQGEDIKGLVRDILSQYKGPIVLDADGINAIDDYRILSDRTGITVITPHPGELARLLNEDIKEIQEHRIFYSKYTSNKYNVIIVLKGNETIIIDDDMLYKNNTGNPGMATAGSGDVLAGMVISFICQGIDPYKACKLAVYSHGLAGDMAKEEKGEYGLIASDILNNIPKALNVIQY
ncbi:NAD(P)H-hydrate dehydratase [Tissierella sp. Yu-01]|uniref:NAD(P)H-hydrate dehydratase n=1 Tax=Tissierella sp. Yu-01 TaxID=3035694 RepID=UPI00240E97B9|nr:NAD(P)H-hydrate dehydratase [Tissierella sp. Yu-01]WFA09120.1 NAD(P)H-hydrate dehydratase [Tissierella sp. Yu-01]